MKHEDYNQLAGTLLIITNSMEKNYRINLSSKLHKMKTSKYYRFAPMILGLVLVAYFYGYKYIYKNNDHFFKNKIQTKIIKVKNYKNKSLQFYYDNEYCITTTNTIGDTLKVGDSISKEYNTKSFDIFRMKNDNYTFFKSYHINK